MKFILAHDTARQRALRAIQQAPEGYVVSIAEPKRSLDQNAKMWAMLTDISMSKPGGRVATPHRWKHIMLSAYGFSCQFETGLDGEFFAVGLSTSGMSKRLMSDFIEFLMCFGANHNVKWSNEYDVKGEPQMLARVQDTREKRAS